MIRDRISREKMFSQICSVVAQRSTCLRSQVGALIVRDGRIISMGYNGPVSGMPACSKPDGSQQVLIIAGVLEPTGTECMGPGCTRSLHAETNAIAFAARAGVSVEGCTMYCSMSPCINCAKVIVNSGIKELKYLEEYRDTSGLELLRKAGITVEQVRGENRDEEAIRRLAQESTYSLETCKRVYKILWENEGLTRKVLQVATELDETPVELLMKLAKRIQEE